MPDPFCFLESSFVAVRPNNQEAEVPQETAISGCDFAHFNRPRVWAMIHPRFLPNKPSPDAHVAAFSFAVVLRRGEET
jgi:hypothetical protein